MPIAVFTTPSATTAPARYNGSWTARRVRKIAAQPAGHRSTSGQHRALVAHVVLYRLPAWWLGGGGSFGVGVCRIALDRGARGHLDGDEPVDEWHSEPFSERGSDFAAASSVRR